MNMKSTNIKTPTVRSQFFPRLARLGLIKRFALSSLVATILLATTGTITVAASKDDPLISTVIVDQFEVRDAEDETPLVVESQGWVGQDLNKLWFKADIERADGETEEAELQILYSKAIAPYWDLQMGVRRDFRPSPNRSWAVIGFQGLSPYFFEVDTALFIGQHGRTALRLEAEYELMLTQQWVIAPEITANIYGKDDKDVGIGSGLSNTEVGLRLRYEIRREIAPYIGITWSKKFGETADYSRLAGADISDTQFVAGIRAWF